MPGDSDHSSSPGPPRPCRHTTSRSVTDRPRNNVSDWSASGMGTGYRPAPSRDLLRELTAHGAAREVGVVDVDVERGRVLDDLLDQVAIRSDAAARRPAGGRA